MKVIITGGTGMVGKGVLLECLDHKNISKVLVIGRSASTIKHPKLLELLVDDFSDFSSIEEQLEGYDACYYCMGVSANGMSEDNYIHLTYDFTMALARVLLKKSPDITFTYVSGEGTDSTEKGNMMWARVKGNLENELLALGFKQAFMYRPGAIIPLRGIKSRTKMYQFMYDYFMWLIKAFKSLSPNSVCNTTQIGLSMINTSQYGYAKNILSPKDIITSSVQ